MCIINEQVASNMSRSPMKRYGILLNHGPQANLSNVCDAEEQREQSIIFKTVPNLQGAFI